MLTQPPNHSRTFYLQNMTFAEGNKIHRQADRPTLSPCEKALRNRHSATPWENSDRTDTLPGWNQEISKAASHPYAQCLWRNDLKFFLQEQDMKNIISSDRSFKRNNSWTNQNNNFEEYIFREFLGGTVSPVQGTCVQSLVQEDSTCCRAIKPVHHNYWSPCA